MIILIALLVNIILRTSKPNSSHCKSQPSEQKISPSLPKTKNYPFEPDRAQVRNLPEGFLL